MSLKAFHIFFIIASIFLAIGFGFWCLNVWRFEGAPWVYALEGAFSLVAAVGLVFYLRSVLQKLKQVPLL